MRKGVVGSILEWLVNYFVGGIYCTWQDAQKARIEIESED